MKTGKVIGMFDCRVFKKDTPRAKRNFVADGERINISVGFTDEELEELDELKEFAHYSEKSNKNYVTFKVFPKNCRLYNASATKVAWPDNEDIDGSRFEMIIDFSVKHGKPGTTELNGLYVNNLQVLKRADVPFEPVEGYNDDFISGADISKPVTVTETDEEEKAAVDDLPF